MIVYAVDIETGGLDRDVHSLLEIAIYRVNLIAGQHCLSFYRLIKPDPLVISQFVLDMHTRNGLLRDCVDSGIPSDEARAAYKTWAFHEGKRMVAAGFNGKFDTEWLKKWSGRDYFSHRVIDPRQNWCKLGDEGIPSTEEAFSRAGLAHDTGSHRAISDCKAVVDLLGVTFK